MPSRKVVPAQSSESVQKPVKQAPKIAKEKKVAQAQEQVESVAVENEGVISARRFSRKAGSTAKGAMNERISSLINLSKEQGYLTVKDVNKALPAGVESAEEIEKVMTILENLEIEVIENDEVELHKQRMEETTELEARNAQVDILDDPVRSISADGAGAASFPRAGGGDFQAHRDGREPRHGRSFRDFLTCDFQLDLARS
jgi:RNA polymerase primary sigma factor